MAHVLCRPGLVWIAVSTFLLLLAEMTIAAAPEGHFRLRTKLSQLNVTGLLRACGKNVYASSALPDQANEKDFTWNVVPALNGLENFVSLSPKSTPGMYLKVAEGANEINNVVAISLVPLPANLSTAADSFSFRVTSGLSDYNMFSLSYPAVEGSFLSAVEGLSGSCAKFGTLGQDASDIALIEPKTRQEKISATWRFEVPNYPLPPLPAATGFVASREGKKMFGAVPLGKFLLQPLSRLAESIYMNTCGGSLYVSTTNSVTPTFSWEFVHPLNKKEGYVSIMSISPPSHYLYSTNGQLLLSPNATGNNASFFVEGGLSDPEMFTFKSFDGAYVTVTNSLSGKCQSQMKSPESDVSLSKTVPAETSDATWRLLAALETV